jgi:hypothetical protein
VNINSISSISRFLPELKQIQPRSSQKLPTGADIDINAETADNNPTLEDINRLLSEQTDKFHNQAAELKQSERHTSIMIKLRTGQELNREDMFFLRKHDEKMYIKARVTEAKITALEAAVKLSNSKQAAQSMLNKAKMLALSNARSSGPDSTDVFIAAAIRRLANRINSMQFKDDTWWKL